MFQSDDWPRQEQEQAVENQRSLGEAVERADLLAVLGILMSDVGLWADGWKNAIARYALDRLNGQNPLQLTPFGIMAEGFFWIHRTRSSFVGQKEAFEMLEFRKGTDYAAAFQRRFDDLARYREYLIKKLAAYDGPCDAAGLHPFIVDRDEDRKDLQEMARSLLEYLYNLSKQLGGDPRSGPTSGVKTQADARPSSEKPGTRSWTQPDLDQAIREYKAKRAARYMELAHAVKSGLKGAKKDAQAIFGRNSVAKALRVRSRSMVSKSEAWVQIAEELGLQLARTRAPGTSRTRRAGRIGHDIALEQHAVGHAAESDPAAGILRAERDETMRMIGRLPPKQAKPILAKYEAGEMTDDEARQTAILLLEKN